jgi:quercetin dioxygenase-like cupin family protein
MYVARGKDANPQRATGAIFMGEVHSHLLVDQSRGQQLRLNLVKFSAGGRTKWHTHTFEQGLIIVEGKGIVATEEAEHVVEAGDAVIVAPNEKHWHGGSETTAMAHIAINGVGETQVLEPVDEVRTKNVG